jgi:hypothetical protein
MASRPDSSPFLRFFCSRRGAAIARAAMLAWSVVGPIVGFIFWGVWGEIRDARDDLRQMKADVLVVKTQTNDVLRRLARLEEKVFP